ncbi:MAG: MBL fold metallo-hydrolase [Chloroflexi bacterium]|nr:MBL fold metallo-hydrolase [Chloroflexota bacterium]
MAEQAKIGNVELIALLDLAPPPFDTTMFFPDVPASAWEKYKKEHLDQHGKFCTNFCGMLVRSEKRVILVDTGMGAGAQGRLLEGLRLRGLKPGDVTDVVMTHFHMDHTGWNITRENGKPRATFPKATYHIGAGDWTLVTSDKSQQFAYVNQTVVPLGDLKVLRPVKGEQSLTSEVSLVPTPGHTPGHTSVRIESKGQKGFVLGDIMHSAVQVSEPTWATGFDTDREMATKTRHAVLERLENDGAIVGACHFLFGRNIGRVVRKGDRRGWSPL